MVILIWRKCGRNRFKCAPDSNFEKSETIKRNTVIIVSHLCLPYVYLYVCLFVYCQMWPSWFFYLAGCGGQQLHRCAQARIFQIHFKFHAKQINHSFVVAAKCCTQRGRRERGTYTYRARERQRERMSIYLYRHLQKFGENLFALLNCKIGPQIKIQHLRLPHENKRRLGRILLVLMDHRLSYWRECKYAIHDHASGR